MPCIFSVGALAGIEIAEGVCGLGGGMEGQMETIAKAVKLLTTPERFRINMEAV